MHEIQLNTEIQQPENPLRKHRCEETKVSRVHSKMCGRSKPNLNG
jgi:hypothetical protein